MSPTFFYKYTKKQKVIWSVLVNSEARNPRGFFIILVTYYNRLSLYQLRVSEWFQQNGKFVQFLETVYTKAKVTSIRAPQHRQYMLISNFPDLAHLSIREEATLANNWSKDRPESLKLQNLALATIPGPASRSYPKNTTEDVKHALDKCESLGSGKQLILQGNPSAIAKDFSRIWPIVDDISYRICNSSAVCCFKAPSVDILTSLRPALNPLLGCSSGRIVQDQLA